MSAVPRTCRCRGWEGSRNCDDSWLRRLALPLSAPSVHAIGRERDWYVAAAARYIPIEWASRDSKVLQNERDHKSAALAQADERDAAMAGGRSYGGGSDGAVPGSRGGIAHVSSPAHLCALLMSAHHSLSRVTAIGVGAWRSSQPSLLVVLAPRSGALEQRDGSYGRRAAWGSEV